MERVGEGRNPDDSQVSILVMPPVETVQEDKQARHGDGMGSVRWWLEVGNAGGVCLGQKGSFVVAVEEEVG